MSKEPYVIVCRTPDALEIKVRIVCGGLLGLIVAAGLCVKLWPLGKVAMVAIAVSSVIACGKCAAKFGDGFWEGTLKALGGLWL